MTEKQEGVALLAEASEAPLLEVEELRALVSEGRERGFLTFEEIAASLEEVEVTKEQVAELHAHLLEHGVDIVADDDRPPGSIEIAGDGAQPAPKKPADRPDRRAEPRLAAALPALDRARRPADRRPGGVRWPSASSAATWSPSSR